MARFDLYMSLVILFLLLGAFVKAEATASTVIAGMVFCDQCKDGIRGLFDYPLHGARVAIQCGGGETPVTVREGTTNWFGGFSVRLEGPPQMNRCTARVVEGTSRCGAGSAAPQELNLAFQMLGLALYTVPPLLAQPEEPMDFCPGRGRHPRLPPPSPPVALEPPSSPVSSRAPPLPPVWHRPALPPMWRMPPLPPAWRQQSPPAAQTAPSPPAAEVHGSACTYDKWLMPENKCQWKVVTPDTTVAVAFGPLAAARYGSDITLREALTGRGDIYRTLLREATAALLNAYYNTPGSLFLYPNTLSVVDHMNRALIGSTQRVLIEAARFRRANAGGGGGAERTRLECCFTPCTSS